MKRSRLARTLDALASQYGPPEPPRVTGVFEQVLWENVAYLVDDERRARAFDALRKTVGTKPEQILAASADALYAVTKLGGMHPEDRVQRLRHIAEVALELGDPESASKRELRKFPSIGEPGAEKILLFAGREPSLALESNGLRVLLRLGYGKEAKSYSTTYRSVQAACADEIEPKCSSLVRAHQLLRLHGQEACKRSAPLCELCPLTEDCAWYAEHQ